MPVQYKKFLDIKSGAILIFQKNLVIKNQCVKLILIKFFIHRNIFIMKQICENYTSQSDYSFREKTDTASKQSSSKLSKPNQLFQNIQAKQEFQSPYSPQYRQYFKDVEHEVDAQIRDCLQDSSRRLQYKLVLLKQDSNILSFEKPLIHLIGSVYNGSIMLYQVVVGNYKLQIKLLNLNVDAPKKLKQLGTGGYGSVYEIHHRKDTFVACKRIRFKYHQTVLNQNQQIWKIRPNPHDLNEIITQYCLYKICSFYKIGPRVNTQPAFDIVCYNESAEFYMEPCIELLGDYEKLEQDLKLALSLLHKLKIIHKDIKPSNILYSPAYKRFILSDFGISHPIKQEIGKLSRTYRQGTVQFMSKQMSYIKQHKAQYIDLYYNDLFGLITSMKNLRKASFSKLGRPKLHLQSMKISEQYFHLYVLALILMKDKNRISQMLQLLKKQKKIIKYPIINSQLNELFQMIFDIIKEKHFDINMFNVFTVQDPQRLSLEFLIRCYGLSKKLEFQLHKINRTNLIDKILSQISSKQYTIPLFNHQALHFMKQNEKQCFLIRNIDNLENQRRRQQGHTYEYTRQIYKNLQHLYNTIIMKPAKYTRYSLEILNKLSQYQQTQQQKIRYILCLICKYKKLGLPSLYWKSHAIQIFKHHPQYRDELLEVLTKFMYDKIQRIKIYHECLIEYFKDQKKHYKNILEMLNLLAYQYYKIGQIQKSNECFRKIQQKIKQYKSILSQHELNTILHLEMKFLAYYFKRQSNFNVALQYYTNFLNKFIEQEGYKYEKIVLWYYEIGICQMKLGKYQQAQASLNRTIKIIEFIQENYRYDNFIQICKMQLISIYLLNNRIEKVQDCIKLIFYKNEWERIHKNNKFLQYDQNLHNYVIQSTEQLILKQLKLIIDQKTINLLKSFDSKQEECIEQIMIFWEQFQYFLNKSNFHKNIIKKISTNNSNYNISFLNKYIQFNNFYILQSIQNIVNHYIRTKSSHFEIVNLMLAQLLKQFSSYTSIDHNISLNLFRFLFENEYIHNKHSQTLAIFYLKLQYSLLTKIYSYQFINCAHRLSIRLFKIGQYHECIYYTMQIVKILQVTKCQEKKRLYQLYRRIIECHILINDYRHIKISQQLKQKQMKYLKKKNVKTWQQLLSFYLKTNKIYRFIVIKCYLQKLFKNNPIQMKIRKNLRDKIKQNQQIYNKIFKNYEQKSLLGQKFKQMKLRKLYLKMQLSVLPLNGNQSKYKIKKLRQQIF